MKWEFSDGTTIWLSGFVEGSSREVESARLELERTLHRRAQPRANRNRAHDVEYGDDLIRRWARYRKITLVSAPELPRLESLPPPDALGRTRWVFADGTVVYVGGEVEGSTLFAAAVRRDVQESRRGDGHGPTVTTRPEPCGSEPMDLENEYHIRQWLETYERCLDKAIIERPVLPPFFGPCRDYPTHTSDGHPILY